MISIFDRSVWTHEVHLLGLGGIGSWMAFWLLKLGVPEIHVYDNDVVKEHNTYYQLWSKQDIGRLKVEALVDFARREGYDTKIIPHVVRVTEDSELELSGVVMSGFDSMMSRKVLWNSHLQYNGMVELYMDGRIGGEEFHLYTLNPSNPEQVPFYKAWLYDDPKPNEEQERCTERDDFHTGIVLSGFMLRNLTALARGGEQLAEIYQGNLSIVVVRGGAIPVVQIP